MAGEHDAKWFVNCGIPKGLFSNEVGENGENTLFYRNLFDFIVDKLNEKYGNISSELDDKLLDFFNNKIEILLEKINEAQEKFLKQIEAIDALNTIPACIAPWRADPMIPYFVCNHFLYKSIQEFLQNESTDYIDKIIGLINDEENDKAFDDFVNVYIERYKKTEEYKGIIIQNFKNPDNMHDALDHLYKITSAEYLFDDKEPVHDFLETDDETVLEELREKKKKMILAEKLAEEEAARKEAEEKRLEAEKKIAEEDAMAEEDAKLDEYEEEPEKIEDIKINKERCKLYIDRYTRKCHSDARKYPELKHYYDEMENFTRTMLANLPEAKGSDIRKSNFRDALNRFVAVNQIIQYLSTLRKNGDVVKYNEITGLREESKNELIYKLTKQLEAKGIADRFIGTTDVSGDLDNIRKLLRFKNTKELVISESGDFETRVLLEGKNAVSADLNKLLDENINKITDPSKVGVRYARLFAIAKSEMELMKNEIVVDKNGNVSKDVIHKLSKIIACTQILMNDQKNKDFLDKAGSFDDIGFEKQISILADNLEKSDYVRTMLSGGNVLQNSKNLLSMVRNASVLAYRLNEADYAKTIFSGKELVPKESSLSEIERIVLKDRLERIKLEEEKAIELTKKNGDIYSVGNASYTQSKNELTKLSSSLSELTLSAGELSSLTSDEHFNQTASSVIEGLKEAARLLNENASKINNFKHGSNANQLIDEEDMKNIGDKLDDLIAQCEDLMQYDCTDNNPLFNNLYSSVISARVRIDEITDGSLFVPDKEHAEDAEFIDAGNPLLSDIMKDFKKENSLEENPELKWVGSKEALFAHDPCADDIMQGMVGDCFFVSTLAAIADKDPQAIRDMMFYNKNDDTVTVRLYDGNNKPRYITVENTVPVFEYEKDGVKESKLGYSKGARWVQIMEKAFSQSGLIKTIHDGGTVDFALHALLGPKMDGFTSSDFNKTQSIRWETTKKRSEQDEYTEADLAVWEKVEKWYNEGRVIGCGTMNDEGMRKVFGFVDILGITNKHAYSLLGLSEENGKKYVHIRNPHGGVGKFTDNEGFNHENDDALGVSKLELKDFLNMFNTISGGSINKTPLQKSDDAMVEKEHVLYSETIKEMDFYLQGSSQIKADDEPVPQQLEDLKKKSMLAAAAINNPDISPNKLHAVLTDYFNSANEYIKYRDETPQSPQQEKSRYSAFCYFAANVIKKLDERFIENQIKGLDNAPLFGVEDLKNEALQPSENDSPAKQASVEKINEINILKKEMDSMNKVKKSTEIGKNEVISEGADNVKKKSKGML